MKLRFAAELVVAAVLLCIVAGPIGADTLVVRGHRVESPVGFVAAGDEVMVPLLRAITYLGAEFEVGDEAIHVTTADGHEIVVARTRPEATRDGVLRELPSPPIEKRGVTLLPAQSMGSLLGCSVNWDPESRTVAFYPWVRRFFLETLADRYRITIGAEGPLSYRAGELEDPPRIFLDLMSVDVAHIPSEFAVRDSYLRSARIHQHATAEEAEEEVTRVVVELSEWRPYRVRESEDRCRLEMELPLPGAVELPPDVPPVILTDLGFRRESSQVAAIKLGVFGTPYCISEASEDPPVISVDVANATNQCKRAALEPDDPLVSGITLGPAPGKPGTQRLTIYLRRAVGHAVVTEEGGLEVLVGQFELGALRVVIDAGHGGHDTGAIGRSGLREKDVNIDIARRVYRRLQAMGVDVRLTRRDDNPTRPWARGNRKQHRSELLRRCEIANEMPADLFVSVHANARRSNPSQYRGTETYYRKADSKRFAQALQKEVVRACRLPDSGVKRHPYSIIVISYTDMPSALVEVGYLSHPADEAELARSEFRERAAQGIANGIVRYVEEGGLLRELARRARARRAETER